MAAEAEDMSSKWRQACNVLDVVISWNKNSALMLEATYRTLYVQQ